MNEKVSISLCTYNGENYIIHQLNSILLQTRKPNQIIIVDDCSKDRTVEVADALLKESGIEYRIISHESNQGIRRSFEEAFFATDGDVIFLCDQDDVWNAKKIEIMLEALRNDSSSLLAFCNARIVDEDMDFHGKTLWGDLHIDGVISEKSSHNDIIKEMLRHNIFTGMAMAIKKEIKPKLSSVPESMLHDEWIAWNCLLNGTVIPVAECLVEYRQHSGNAVGSGKYSKFSGISAMIEKIRNSSLKSESKWKDISRLTQRVIGTEQGDVDISVFMKNINSAYSFYQERNRYVTENTRWFGGFVWIIKAKCRRLYQRYSSETEHAFIKDCLVSIIGRKRKA